MESTLLFKVIDQNNMPIKGAEIVINNISIGITDPAGILLISNIPIGSYLPYFVAAVGYNRPTGYVNISSTFQEQTVVMISTPWPF